VERWWGVWHNARTAKSSRMSCARACLLSGELPAWMLVEVKARMGPPEMQQRLNWSVHGSTSTASVNAKRAVCAVEGANVVWRQERGTCGAVSLLWS